LLFGENIDVKSFSDIVKLYLKKDFNVEEVETIEVSLIIKSKFKQLQETGQEAELYFKKNFQQLEIFKNGSLEDARLLGNGYDFQIQIETKYFLVDVKEFVLMSLSSGFANLVGRLPDFAGIDLLEFFEFSLCRNAETSS
jgi:hypothetical protein